MHALSTQLQPRRTTRRDKTYNLVCLVSLWQVLHRSKPVLLLHYCILELYAESTSSSFNHALRISWPVMEFNLSGQMHSMAPPQKPRKGLVLSRNDQKWEYLKDEIQRVYMKENNTLPRTMLQIEQAHGFKASPRKWKDKLKEWGFEKNLSENDMRIVVAKVDKRKAARKETHVFLNGVQMTVEKLENFKKRKTVRESGPASPSASTPGPVTYSTPRCDLEMSLTREMDETVELDDTFTNLDFSAQVFSAPPQPQGLNVEDTNLYTSRTTSYPLLSHEDDLTAFSLNDINEDPSEAAEDVSSLGDSSRTFASGSRLSPRISISNREGLVSSQPPNAGELDRAADEHDKTEKPYPAPSDGPSELPSGHQGAAEIIYHESSMDSENDIEPGTSHDKSLPAPLEEYNLVMLSKTIDECFKRRFELDLTLSQLLSILTYLQGPPLQGEEPSSDFLSYWETKGIAVLAKTYIKEQASFTAVCVFMRVVEQAQAILGGAHYPGFMPRLERTFPFSRIVGDQSYLNHEVVVLQITLSCYFKFQLESGPLSNASIGVVERLRCIQEPKSTLGGYALDDLIGFLNFRSTSTWTSNYDKLQLHREHFFHAMNLARYYSLRGEFEIAETLYLLRHMCLDKSPLSTLIFTGQGYGPLPESFETDLPYNEHQYRRLHVQNGTPKPRVRPWNAEMQHVPSVDSIANVEKVYDLNPDLNFQIKDCCKRLILNTYD
ncbi:hypothetical protein V8E51_008476 [Hyaloscypha variabilis]